MDKNSVQKRIESAERELQEAKAELRNFEEPLAAIVDVDNVRRVCVKNTENLRWLVNSHWNYDNYVFINVNGFPTHSQSLEGYNVVEKWNKD